MNYNSILDPFFSNWWICFGTLFGLLAIGLVFRKPLYFNRKYKVALGFLYFSLFLLGLFSILIFNPTEWGYGKSIGMKSLMVSGNELYAMDYRLMGGGEADDPEPYYRIHKLDAGTGEKKFRFLAGAGAELSRITNDAIVCRLINELVFFSKADGSLIAEWSDETLPGLYPELSAGIDNFSPYNSGEGMPVTGLDGRSWLLDPENRRIQEQKNDRRRKPLEEKSNAYSFNEYGIKKGDHEIIRLRNQGNEKREQLYADNDSLLNRDLYFIDGRPVAIDMKDSCFIILHYTTTTHLECIVSCLSLDCKKLKWEIRQSGLGKEAYEYPPDICYTPSETGEIFYLGIQDEVIAIQVRDGKIRWRTAL